MGLAQARPNYVLRYIKFVFIFFAILAFSSAQQQARIVSSPQSLNVSSGDHAVFNCTAIATFINWEINGVSLDADLMNKGFIQQSTIVLNSSQNLQMLSLSVLGSPDSDNANIVCVAVLQLSTTEFVGNSSDPALLLVQGPLRAVSDLTVVPINSTTVLISWRPPFTLEGVPILGYTVTITNTTSGENETMSVEGETTMLYYSIDHPDPDNNFTVTVVPINGAGRGGDATILFFFDFLLGVVYSTKSTTPVFTSFSKILESRNYIPLLSSTVVFGQSSSAYTTTIVPSVSIPDSSDNLTVPVLISVNVITVVTILSTVTAIMCCYILRKYIKTRAKGPLQDVVPVSDNPAYQMVIIQRTNRTDVNSQLKETASIITGQSTVTSPQYENIPAGVDIEHAVPRDNSEYEYEKVE